MLFKRLNISFYKKIKLLIIKNGFQIPNYFFWKKLWDNNPKTIIGDGLFFKNNLVGYHSYFRKKLVFRGKNYNILVSEVKKLLILVKVLIYTIHTLVISMTIAFISII